MASSDRALWRSGRQGGLQKGAAQIVATVSWRGDGGLSSITLSPCGNLLERGARLGVIAPHAQGSRWDAEDGFTLIELLIATQLVVFPRTGVMFNAYYQ